MSITLQFESFEKLIIWLKNLSVGMKYVARDIGQLLTQEAEELAKDRVRSSSRKPGKGTGAYFQSIHSEFKDGTVSFSGNLKSDSPIAGIIEFGSPPHIIRARGDKLLFWPGAGHPVKEVKHPGTPPFRVLGDAVEEAALKTKEKINEAIKKQFAL
ncbi:MAG: hypothetical protein H8E32_11165 [Nitrospinae bacterium]|nr:hypothetical protein [Nitrospinota bacterium]